MKLNKYQWAVGDRVLARPWGWLIDYESTVADVQSIMLKGRNSPLTGGRSLLVLLCPSPMSGGRTLSGWAGQACQKRGLHSDLARAVRVATRLTEGWYQDLTMRALLHGLNISNTQFKKEYDIPVDDTFSIWQEHDWDDNFPKAGMLDVMSQIKVVGYSKAIHDILVHYKLTGQRSMKGIISLPDWQEQLDARKEMDSLHPEWLG